MSSKVNIIVVANLITEESHKLFDITEALHVTGQEKLALKLENIGEHIAEYAVDIRLHEHEAVQEMAQQARENTTNMINGVMAGIELGKGE